MYMKLRTNEQKEKSEPKKKSYVRTFFGLVICCSFSLYRRYEFFVRSLARLEAFKLATLYVMYTYIQYSLLVFSMENLPRVCFYDGL